MHGLAQNVEIRVVGALVAAGAAIDNNSARIDMAGYESVTFVAAITDSVATGVATLTIEQGDADSDAGMAAISGTAASRASAANDDINGMALVSEVFKPNKRFVQAVRTSATANIAYGDVIAILVPRRLPAAQGATVAAVRAGRELIMRLRCVAPPETEALTLAQAKSWLRVDGDEQDALIAGLVAAAVAYLDGWTGVLGRALEPQTWEMRLDGFGGEIALPLGPVASVESVTYRDADGAEVILPAEDYELLRGTVRACLRPVADWPAAATDVTVAWVAGEGCPEPIRQAIRMLIAHWDANREAVGPGAPAELPMGVSMLIEPWRVKAI